MKSFLNTSWKARLYLFILLFTGLSLIGLFQMLQNFGIMIGFDTRILFLPLKWIMFISLAFVFYDINKGGVI